MTHVGAVDREVIEGAPDVQLTALPDGNAPVAPARPPAVPVSFMTAVRADMAELAKTKGAPYPSRAARIDVLTLPGFWAVFLWRVANHLHAQGLRPLSRLVYFVNLVTFGADLHAGAEVGPGFVMPHPVSIAIASDVVIGARCRMLRGVGIGGSGNPKRPGHPVIGDDVWIMDSAKVFGPVTIGDRTVVGAGAIVATDVPEDMFVEGTRRARVFRPLAEMDLADHGGSLARPTMG
jgi:serine O-acetyltransferase